MRKVRSRQPLTLTKVDQQFLFDGWERFDLDIDHETIQGKWDKYKTEVMKEWFNEPDNLFKRPWSWWQYDNPEARRKVININGNIPHKESDFNFGKPTGWNKWDHEKQPVFETQRAYLIRKNLLTEQEKTIIET